MLRKSNRSANFLTERNLTFLMNEIPSFPRISPVQARGGQSAFKSHRKIPFSMAGMSYK